MYEKKCTKCGEQKPFNEFNKGKHPDGLRTECRECQSVQTEIDSERRRQRVRLSRHQQLMQGLSPQDRRIYDCTPSEPTARKLIAALVEKQTGMRDQRAIFGCLNALTEKGLLKESSDGIFNRVQVALAYKSPEPTQANRRPPIQCGLLPEATTAPPVSVPQIAEITHMTPLEKMTAIAQQAAELQSSCKKLVSSIETAALEIEQLFSDRDAESKKLQDLKNLLKSLG